MRPPVDIRKALQDLREELERESYSARYPLEDRERKYRIARMIDMKLAGRLGGYECLRGGFVTASEALPDGWR